MVWSGIVHYFTSYTQPYQMMEAKMPVLPLRACLTGTFWNAVLVVAGALNPAVNSSTCVLNICSELMFYSGNLGIELLFGTFVLPLSWLAGHCEHHHKVAVP